MRRTVRKHTILAAFVVPRVLVVLAGALFATPCPVLAQEIPVTACGQEVPPATTGYLTADLDCTAMAGQTRPGTIILNDKASLDLRGFTLTADQDGGVACLEECRKLPPGISGIYCTTRQCRIFGGGTIVGHGGHGIAAARRIDIENVTLTGFDDVVFNTNDVFLRNVQITGNALVFYAVTRARIEDSSITGNDLGVSAPRVRLVSSTVLGNGPFDLYTARKPVLRDGSQCGISLRPGRYPWLQGGTWGVCAND